MVSDVLSTSGRLATSPLDPASAPVDGRSLRDRLAFAATYARLIWFFNLKGERQGDWQDFFLKDPVILTALMSKTDYTAFHTRYLQYLAGVQDHDQASLGPAIAGIANLIPDMCQQLDGWLGHMVHSRLPTDLFQVLRTKIDNSLSEALWRAEYVRQIFQRQTPEHGMAQLAPLTENLSDAWSVSQGATELAMRAKLTPRKQADGAESADASQASGADAGRNQAADADDQVDPAAALNLLKHSYHTIFDSFVEIVDLAYAQLDKLLGSKCEFPDTALFHAFARLMAVQQDQINTYGQAHLDFYYRTILRQVERPAVSDKVIVCVRLDDTHQALTVPAGTAFTAGTNPDGTPIVFSNASDECVNSVAPVGAYTAKRTSDGWRVTPIGPVDTLVRNEAGAVRDWPMFGGDSRAASAIGAKDHEYCTVLASPMFYLASGERQITLTLTFSGKALQPKEISLSTAAGWRVVDGWTPPPVVDDQLVEYCIKWASSEPAVVPMPAALGALESAWPQLKIVWNGLAGGETQGVVTSIGIDVCVDGMAPAATTFNPTIPAQSGESPALGPTPALGSTFHVALPECLSKPLAELSLTIPWTNLPSDLSSWYAIYNLFLQSTAATGTTAAPFDNECFKGCWEVLACGNWQTREAGVCVFPQSPPPASGLPSSQFQLIGLPDPAFMSWNPVLQGTPVLPPAQARDGYVRFRLTEPAAGFGQSIYAQVVAFVAFCNAQRLLGKVPADKPGGGVFSRIFNWIMGKAGALWKLLFPEVRDPQDAITAAETADIDSTPLSQPQPPYVPMQQGPIASYRATARFDGLAGTKGDAASAYPLEIFHVGPFGSAMVWSAATPACSGAALQLLPGGGNQGKTDNKPATAGVPVVPVFDWDGCLLLPLSGAATSGPVSLYVNVTPAVLKSKSRAIQYWYRDVSQWSPLTVLSDETDGLCNSGIVRFDLPELPNGSAVPVPTLATPATADTVLWLAVTRHIDMQMAPRELATHDDSTAHDDSTTKIVRRTSSHGIVDEQWTVPTDPINDDTKVSFIGAQVLRLVRSSAVANEAEPFVAAQAIQSPPLKGMERVIQPFASSGGCIAEQATFAGDSSFYGRVAERLQHKDRAASSSDWLALVREANPDVYYAEATCDDEVPGGVRVLVVGRRTDASAPDAFRPCLDGAALKGIRDFLASRVSPYVSTIRVANFKQVPVWVNCKIVATDTNPQQQLRTTINEQIQLYFAPWVGTSTSTFKMSAMRVDDVFEMLKRIPGVKDVTSCKIFCEGVKEGLLDGDRFEFADSIFVPYVGKNVTQFDDPSVLGGGAQ